MSKIHGRPLLPWWVYALYFAFAITVAVWHNVAHGDEMADKSVRFDEDAMARAIAKALMAHTKDVGSYGDRMDYGRDGIRSSAPEVDAQRELSPYRVMGLVPEDVASTARDAARQARRLNKKELGDPARSGKMGDTSRPDRRAELAKIYTDYALAPGEEGYWPWGKERDGVEPPPGIRADLEEARMAGRYGDTELAHVNPFEKAILKAMGGAGTINPKTGYKEYYSAADAVGAGDFSNEPDVGSSPGLGGFGTDTGTGGVTIDRTGSRTYDPGTGSPFGGAGGAPTYDPGIDATRGLMGLGPQTSVQGPPTGIEGAINRALTSRTPNPMISPTSYGMYKGMQALGEYVGKPLNDMFGGNARAEAPPSFGPESGNGGIDYFNQSIGLQPVAAPTPAFMRPAEEPPPPAFGMAGGMTDLQKRAQIATGGTQGNAGQFRTPEAMRYYGNLIARALIGDNNAVSQQSPNLLPIEDTYLKQVFGVTPQNNSATLLDALKPYWSR